MKNFFKLRTTLYSVLIVAMILSSASFTISAIQQDDTASGITEVSEYNDEDTYMVLEPQEKLIKKFESVPEIQVIEKYIPIEESDIPTSLVGVDTISIKHALLIDGQENDMLRTFDNPENAIHQIYEKASGLLDILSKKYGLDRMNHDNWKKYQECMYEYINTCIQNNQQMYQSIGKDEHVLKVFFFFYENTEQNNELISQINQSKTRSVGKNITIGDLIMQLPGNTPLAEEVQAIRVEENLEQLQNQKDVIQTRDANVANYFNIEAGRNYALKWATKRNYSIYGTLYADCTNFVSQILHEGGFPMAFGESQYWWCKKGRYPTYGVSWINANSFVGYWFGVDYHTTSLLDFSGNIREGDFIAVDYGLDWSYDHLGFVAWLGTYDWHTNSYGHAQYYRDFVVAQHTSDYQAWVSSDINGWDNVEGLDTENTREGRYVRVWTR